MLKKCISLLLVCLAITSIFAIVPIDTNAASYKEEFIDAVLDSEGDLWDAVGAVGYAYLKLIDLNFDGKIEFIKQYSDDGGFSLSSTSPIDVFYYENGKLVKANTTVGINNELTGYYNEVTNKYMLIQPFKGFNGYDNNYTLYNQILEFNGKDMRRLFYSSMIKKDNPSDNVYYDGPNGYLGTEKSNIITKEEYDSLNNEIIKNCVNINMQYQKIKCLDWINYSSSQKRQALEEAYDSFTYDTNFSNAFSPQKDGWSFVNGYEGFNYSSGYSIPEERYREVFGDEYVAAAKTDRKTFKSMMPSWGGNCYGMSVSAVAFNLGILDWSRYDDLYENDFSTVNKYYNTLRYSSFWGNDTLYTSSDNNTEITKLIERYQILQLGDESGYRYGSNSTYSLIFGNYCSGENDYESYRGWFKKTDTYRHLPDGSYIRDIYNKIINSKTPLLVSMKGALGGHAMVVRTDKKPVLKDGWYRVYIYDPNHPYLPDEYLSQYDDYSAESYYLNNISEDTYIELNLKENKWRYNGSLNSSSSNSYWGCDANGDIKTFTVSTTDDIKNIIPEWLVIYDISNVNFPTVFDGTNQYWTRDTDSNTINVTETTNIVLKTQTGKEICEVVNGMVLSSVDNVVFYPYEGVVAGESGFTGGRLVVPYKDFVIEYISGDDISILSNNNIISIATEQEADIRVNTNNNSVDITSNDSSEFIAKISNFETGAYVGTYAQGTIDAGENVSLEYTDDILTVSSNIDGDNIIGIYFNNDTSEDYKPVAMITDTNNHVKIENVSEIEEVMMGDTDSDGEVSIMDATAIQLHIAKISSLSTHQINNADTDGDGEVSIMDATEIQLFVAKLIPALGEREFITLSSTQLTMNVGDKKTLTATVKPLSLSNTTVIWSSSNSSIVSVVNGVVEAKGLGTATITAKTKSGVTAKCTITVKDKTVEVSSIKLNSNGISLNEGNTYQLVATVLPENATNKTLTWSTNNPSVATVSSSGKITAVSIGKATITAKSSNGVTITCAVSVVPIQVSSITLSDTNEVLYLGFTHFLTATVKPDNANDKSLTWSSSDTSVVTVSSSGSVTAKGLGTATVTARATNGVSASCVFTVCDILPDSLMVSKNTQELDVGQSFQLTGTITPSYATNKTITWSSSDTSVATVTQSGNVKAVGNGKATITAKTVNGIKAVCEITSYTPVSGTYELFLKLRKNPAGCYRLTADDTLNTLDLNIDTFTGCINGDGHTITIAYDSTSNNVTNNCYKALLPKTNGAIIKNLNISGTIDHEMYSEGSYSNYCAGFVAYAENTTFVNCTNEAMIKSTIWSNYSGYGYVGGITAWSNNCNFTDCTNKGGLQATTMPVKVASSIAGGISGQSSGCKFDSCSNSGNVYAHSSNSSDTYYSISYSGGIVGSSNSSELKMCVTSGNMMAYAWPDYETYYTSVAASGGIIAYGNGKIENCSSSCNLNPSATNGGVIYKGDSIAYKN